MWGIVWGLQIPGMLCACLLQELITCTNTRIPFTAAWPVFWLLFIILPLTLCTYTVAAAKVGSRSKYCPQGSAGFWESKPSEVGAMSTWQRKEVWGN